MNRIKEIRTDLGISADELSSFLKITRRTLYSIETKDSNISSSILIELSKIFNSSIDYILGISDIDFFKSNEYKTNKEIKDNLLSRVSK